MGQSVAMRSSGCPRSWQFDGNFGLHEQLVKDEEALRSYQIASSKNFSQDLVLATC